MATNRAIEIARKGSSSECTSPVPSRGIGPELCALTFQFPGHPTGGKEHAELGVGKCFAGVELHRPGAHIQGIVEIDFGALMGMGGNEEDASLLRALQMWQEQVGQQEVGQIVHLAVPFEAILRGHLSVGEYHSGIVHQHIDPLEFRHQLAGKVMDTTQRTEVQVACLHEVPVHRIVILIQGIQGCAAAQLTFDYGRRPLPGLEIAAGEDYPATSASQSLGYFEANAAVAAGDHHDLLLDLIIVRTALAAH